MHGSEERHGTDAMIVLDGMASGGDIRRRFFAYVLNKRPILVFNLLGGWQLEVLTFYSHGFYFEACKTALSEESLIVKYGNISGPRSIFLCYRNSTVS